MKLTYWIAEIETDHQAYNVRAKTRREAKAMVAERDWQDYGPVRKITVEYRNAFDLIERALGEGGIEY